LLILRPLDPGDAVLHSECLAGRRIDQINSARTKQSRANDALALQNDLLIFARLH
jgi:hypothetical protein